MSSGIGPLVAVDSVPSWLRQVVEASRELDARTFTRFSAPDDVSTRPASVLILFGDTSRGPDVLLLRRADDLDAHAGQAAFPGGGAEPTDAGPVQTALREAEEETGVDPLGVRPVAVLPDLYVPVSGFSVTPVVAHWASPSPVYPVDPAETAAVARVPIGDLADPAHRFQVSRGDTWKGPAFETGGLFVWGFTAGLLSVLLGLGGWEQDWDRTDVRDLDVALAEHEARERAVGRE